MGDDVVMILDEAVKEAAFTLNCMIRFADIPKGDKHNRMFFVYGRSTRNLRDSIDETKYGIGILYIIDGAVYELQKPVMKKLTIKSARAYADSVLAFVNDISNAYSSVDICQFDMEFMEMVGSGEITKTTDPRIMSMLKRRSK